VALKSDSELKHILSVIAATKTHAEAAAELGMSTRTLRDHKARMRVKGWKVPERGPTAPDALRSPGEIRDAEFWRKIAKERESELSRLQKTLDEISGLAETPVAPPNWTLPKGLKKGKAILGLFLSDVHAGEVIDGDEILGVNAYNVEICRERLRRYFAAACVIGQRWMSDCTPAGAFLALGGDLISGDIHDELKQTNALTAHEQVLLFVEEAAAGIRHVLDAYGRVHIASVPGNHGRTTIKSHFKQYARLSYDTLAAKMLQGIFAHDKRVTFQIAAGPDVVVDLLGKRVFLTHGDKMGTGGGAGFAGPILPIIRGIKKIEIQQFHAKKHFDLLLSGHYHLSANANNALSSGSVPGYSEFAHGIRASIEEPSQWLFLLHERRGLRERVEIRLGD
jgi:hypothetical protein